MPSGLGRAASVDELGAESDPETRDRVGYCGGPTGAAREPNVPAHGWSVRMRSADARGVL
jgi:hypothetical protein